MQGDVEKEEFTFIAGIWTGPALGIGDWNCRCLEFCMESLGRVILAENEGSDPAQGEHNDV